MMNISVGQLVVWLLVGGTAGMLVGMLVRHRKRGYGLVRNLTIGLVGALIGGFLFHLLNIHIGEEIQFSLNDLIAAVVGSLILLAGLSRLPGRH